MELQKFTLDDQRAKSEPNHNQNQNQNHNITRGQIKTKTSRIRSYRALAVDLDEVEGSLGLEMQERTHKDLEILDEDQ